MSTTTRVVNLGTVLVHNEIRPAAVLESGFIQYLTKIGQLHVASKHIKETFIADFRKIEENEK